VDEKPHRRCDPFTGEIKKKLHIPYPDNSAASLKMMPYEERGCITIKEAAILFSREDDEYAFREKNGGTRNLASFVAGHTHHCSYAFVEGRLYFIRTASNGLFL
jgi:hypothetical protein